MATKTKAVEQQQTMRKPRARIVQRTLEPEQEPPHAPVAPEGPPSGINWERIGAASGIGFAALLIASFAVVPYAPPKGGDSIGEVLRFFSAHRTGVLVSTYLAAASLGAFLWFLGSVRAELRHGNERLAAVAHAGGIAAVAIGGISFAFPAALALVAGNLVATDVARALFAQWVVMDKITALPWAVFVGASSLVMIRTGVVSKRLGWIGAALAAAIASYGGGIVVDDGALALNDVMSFATMGCFVVWTLALSVLLVRKPPHDSRTVPKHH